MSERLILFAKPPVWGRVKTRLARTVGVERACALYVAFLRDTLAITAAARRPERSIELCADGTIGTMPPELTHALPELRLTEQGGGDLGERLERAAKRSLREGVRRVAFIGADAPDLPLDRVDEAFAALESGADVSLVPAVDGGYALIAIESSRTCVFRDIPWGTGAVLETTRRRAADAGCSIVELESHADVDDADDLRELGRRLARAGPDVAPATRRALGTGAR